MFKNLNPRRVWLLRKQGEAINSQAKEYLPKPFSGVELIARARGLSKSDSLVVSHPDPSSLEGSDSSSDALLTGRNPGQQQNKNIDLGVAGAEAALFYGQGLYEKFQQVDDHVYEAMSRLAGDNIVSLADLHASLGEYKHDVLGEISNSVLSKWKGHLAEVYAAEHFTDAGHEVVWPSASNQEGYDFFLDGHAVNVKLVADASSLHEHFSRFPDIPVVVPGDVDLGTMTSGAFHFEAGAGLDQQLDAFLTSSESHRVIVDHAMSAAAIKEQAMDAADVAVGGANVAEAHFPWITAATASWREGRLLYENKTDWKTAGKNLAVDVVGRGGGALLGAKTGAALGTMLAPGVGTAIGGFLGGVLGGISGGMGSNAIKRKALEAAVEQAKQSQEDLKNLQAYLERSSKQDVSAKKRKLQAEMDALRNAHKSGIDLEANELRKWREKAVRAELGELDALLKQNRSEFSQFRAQLDERLKNVGFWRRWIWPDATTLVLDIASDRLNESLNRVENSNRNWVAGGGVGISAVAEILGQEGVGRSAIEKMLIQREVERLRRETVLRSKIETAYDELASARHNSFQVMADLIRALSIEIRNKLTPKLEDLQLKIEQVNVKKRKLGMAD